MIKIGEICPAGAPAVCVYYDKKAASNPYRVYEEWKAATDHGLYNRRKLVARYSDLYSCAWYMQDYVKDNNEEGRAV